MNNLISLRNDYELKLSQTQDEGERMMCYDLIAEVNRRIKKLQKKSK